MKNELYFENVTGIGNLYLDYIFLEFEYEPIYFTCTDESDQLYLCLCSEIRKSQHWIISKCNTDVLQHLINNEIDMAHALCVNTYVITIDRDLNGKEYVQKVPVSEIDELDLPKSGIMLKCDKISAGNYLLNKEFKQLSYRIKETIDITNLQNISVLAHASYKSNFSQTKINIEKKTYKSVTFSHNNDKYNVNTKNSYVNTNCNTETNNYVFPYAC